MLKYKEYGLDPFKEGDTADLVSVVMRDRFRHTLDGGWFHWGEHGWERDPGYMHKSAIELYLASLGADLRNDLNEMGDASAAEVRRYLSRETALGSLSQIQTVETLLKHNARLFASITDFDARPELLGTPSGVVDLRKAAPIPLDMDDMVLARTRVEPEFMAPTPVFDKFMDEITCGDADLRAWLARWLGYCLTGEIREHKLAYFHGAGGNGKSTLVETLRHAMGDYAVQTPEHFLMRQRNEQHLTRVAHLRGSRLAVASEVRSGATWDDAKIASLTGGDKIAAHYMRRDLFEFEPTHKLVVMGNSMPNLREVTDGLRRRICIVPFAAKFDESNADRGLVNRLRAESGAILAGLISEARLWYEEGLPDCDSIDSATEEYFETADTVASFLEERCEVDAPPAGAGVYRCRPGKLYDAYVAHCTVYGVSALGSAAFKTRLLDEGLGRVTISGRVFWTGVRLANDA